MDLERIVIIGVNPQEKNRMQSSEHMFADIVLIDKSKKSLKPLLYHVKEEDFDDENSLSLKKRTPKLLEPGEAFVMVGEVVSIDKEKKQIFLSNDNSVTYRHLIIATGEKHTHFGHEPTEDFANGINALIDALMLKGVRTNFPIPLQELQKPGQKTPHFHFIAKEQEKGEIEKIVHPRIKITPVGPYPGALNDKNKRLFEVQV